jgi:chromatin segregation and condensation protein Rec8/ScpA/Scc1 (kleisin family)
LHKTFNEMYPDLATYKGFKEIFRLLDNKEITTTQLFDRMVKASKKVLKGEKLKEVLDEIQRIRDLFGA